MTYQEAFLDERRRARRFFNRMSPLYTIVERHLFPQYRDVLARLALPSELSVLDLATGTGLLAGAFAERGHGVTGLDFAETLLTRARRRFPRVDFRNLDLRHLDRIESGAYDLVAMGYFLHGLSPEFRRFILQETARIARTHVLIFDYGRDGGWFIRFIEWIEGPNYPLFIAEDRKRELGQAGLQIDREEPVSDFGSYWLCTPYPRGSLVRRMAPGKNSRHRDDSIRAHPVKDTDCTAFLQWALPRLGMRWPGFRRVRGQVCKRLGRRMAELGLTELSEYRALLETDPEEWTRFDGLCRISISRFYRDQGVWRMLEREIFPHLAERARTRGEDRPRIWSAGCASGEEPYTLALLFALGEALSGYRPEIAATDADPHLLERARRGCYPKTSLRDLPERWRAAFEPFGEAYCLRADYRKPVRFLEQDIRHECPEGRFDLILCRNLAFTYFETSLQAEIARRLVERLVPEGVLVLGIHESLPESVPMLGQERPWLYRKREE